MRPTPATKRQNVGVEKCFEEVDRADPGQAEAEDQGQAHVAEGHPARVHQVDGEEQSEGGDARPATPAGDGLSRRCRRRDDHAARDDGHAQRVDQRLGEEAARQVAVGELDEADQQQQRREGVGRPADSVQHVGEEKARDEGQGDPVAPGDPRWRSRLTERRPPLRPAEPTASTAAASSRRVSGTRSDPTASPAVRRRRACRGAFIGRATPRHSWCRGRRRGAADRDPGRLENRGQGGPPPCDSAVQTTGFVVPLSPLKVGVGLVGADLDTGWFRRRSARPWGHDPGRRSVSGAAVAA